MKVCCDRMKSQKLTTECLCYDSHQVEVEAWGNKDTCFIPTTAAKYIGDYLQTNSSLNVTGLPGIGKSITVHHVALKLRDTKGFTIIPCHCPADIPLHFRKGRKTVFVVDDICGKYTIDEIEAREWQKYLSGYLTILGSGDIKILTSNRYSVFRDPHFKKLKVFSENGCDLSFGCNSISVEEKKKIALKYLPQKIFETIEEYIGQMDYFPLLCQQYTTRPITDPLKYFKNPYEIFEQELMAMKEEDKLKFCAVFICVLLNGSIRTPEVKYGTDIHIDIIDDGYDVLCDSNTKEIEIYGTHSEISRRQLTEIFDLCELNRETPTTLIFRQYDCLLNTYIQKEDIYYHCIHDKVFEFMCHYFGKHLQREIILYCNSKVVRDHTYLLSLNEEHDTFSILIEKDNETHYFLRIIDDISKGRIYDVFYNKQMQFSNYRSKFINFLQKNRQLNLSELFDTKDRTREEGTDPVTSLYVVCYNGYTDLAEFILDKTENHFDKDYYPLNAAASSGHCDLLELMISKGAEVNHRDSSGHTPMTIACINKHEAAIKMLIEKGADFNKRTNKGPTPLMWACSNGNTQIVNMLLIHGADVNKSDYEGKTPVMWARKRYTLNILDRLIYKGANLNKGDNNEWTSLMWGCFYGLTNIVKILILNGADINQVNDEGLTSFMIACKRGQIDIVKNLITKDVNINMRDNFGRSAFMLACTGEQENIVNLLIENKADINCKDAFGVTPLLALCSHGHLSLASILLQAQANCNEADNERWTPLMASCSGNNYKLTKLLVEQGADLNKINKNCETALLIVCMGVINRSIAFCIDSEVYLNPYENIDKRDNKSYEDALLIVIFLLQKGANIDQPDKDGWSPLMWAYKNNYTEVVSLLIENGANVNHLSLDGKSIFRMALYEEKKDILELLFRRGIDEFSEFIHAIRNDDMETIKFIIEGKIPGCMDISKILPTRWQIMQVEKSKYLINKFDNEGDTPLLFSCRCRNLDITKYLIQKGADVNMPTSQGETALRIACSNFETNLVKLLIEAGANVYKELVFAFHSKIDSVINFLLKIIPNIDEMLYKSCQFHETEIAYLLIENGADITSRIADPLYLIWLTECIDPSQALMLACPNSKTNIITALLKSGANVNTESKTTPLMRASYKSNKDILSLLVKSGANVNAIDSNGWNALRWAFYGRNINNVDYLIEEGANIKTAICTMRDRDSWIFDTYPQKGRNIDKIFGILCENGSANIVDNLLSNGVDIHHQDEKMWTPLMRACNSKNKAVIRLLLTRGSNVNSDLLIAVKQGERNLAKSLIEAGGDLNKIVIELCEQKDRETQIEKFQNDVNIHDVLHIIFDLFTYNCSQTNIFQLLKCSYIRGGSTCCKYLVDKCRNEDLVETLYEASKSGNFEIMQLLIEKNINLNQNNEDGDSPLMLACKKECHPLVESLINNGADTGEAFIWAFRRYDVISTKLLLECGADVNKIDPIKWSPLTWACLIRQEKITISHYVSPELERIIDLLISNGADVNYALQKVCESQYDTDKESSIELLINKGADTHFTDENGSTLLKLLKRDGNIECVKLLRLYGRQKTKCIIM